MKIDPMMKVNPMKRELAAGGTVRGVGVYEFATPGIGRILAAAGADFVLLDQEHTGWSANKLRPLVESAASWGVVPILRPPGKDPHLIAAALDTGAMGLMLSAVEDAADAERIVTASKYAPDGLRGVGLLYTDQLADGDEEALLQRNREQLLIAIIETDLGIENVEEIAAVPGIDMLWLGHHDLSASLGIAGQFEHPTYVEAVNRMLAAGEAHGKAVGLTVDTRVPEGQMPTDGFRAFEIFDIGIFEHTVHTTLRTLPGGQENPSTRG
ncbi:MAG: aldolase/citrate lyase family protein [Nocardioides sp.]|uniref:HpcH/HpaI aldolase family protein n=1 Tax=Nocardioides sp. TaxID=35761 RepID=UPI0039E6C277